MRVQLFLIEYKIDEHTYCARLPARHWAHAEELAQAIGARVLGSDIHEVSATPAEELMGFCDYIALEPIRWPHNAAEQVEAFLTIGRKIEPEDSK